MFVPMLMVRQIYTIGSLQKNCDGIVFKLKNRLKDGCLCRLISISINNEEISPDKISISTAEIANITPAELEKSEGIDIPLGAGVKISIADFDLVASGKHQINMRMELKPLGEIHLEVKDEIKQTDEQQHDMPRDNNNDLSASVIGQRQEVLKEFCKSSPDTVFNYTLNTQSIKGNIEHFVGAAQIPIGIAGPITVNGEYAKGQFLIPMATTEGTLVASYNRGMKLLNRNGGVKATVVEDLMQRAPVFVFNDAREARDFLSWIKQNFEKIKKQADETDPHVGLVYIDHILSNKFAFLRFNFSTGDAAGQNMVGRATFVACSWVLAQYKGVVNFFLESNLATDKKSSQINLMRTRGKRVTAEATIKQDDLRNLMRVEPEQIDYHARVSAVGSFLAGTTNTGLHSANGIAAMFIATGQDVANVSESSAAILYSEVDKNGDLYLSVTIPALIVATCGGGTGLSTQRECLEMLDCVGTNKAKKLAEIIASVVLAGEISLACAISSLDWVPSHEEYGRN